MDRQPFKYLKNMLILYKEQKLIASGVKNVGMPFGEQKEYGLPQPKLPPHKKPRKNRRNHK